MPSIADDVRAALRERVAAMTVDERLALTAQLAESDLQLFCARRALSREEGRRALVQRRQAGRLPSRVMRSSTAYRTPVPPATAFLTRHALREELTLAQMDHHAEAVDVDS